MHIYIYIYIYIYNTYICILYILRSYIYIYNIALCPRTNQSVYELTHTIQSVYELTYTICFRISIIQILVAHYTHGVATISRLLKTVRLFGIILSVIGLFCKRDLEFCVNIVHIRMHMLVVKSLILLCTSQIWHNIHMFLPISVIRTCIIHRIHIVSYTYVSVRKNPSSSTFWLCTR